LKQRLASVNLKTGRIRLDPALKGRYRQGVARHMKMFLNRRRAGDSFSKALKAANKVERGNMSKKQWLSYNGVLGSVARQSKARNTLLRSRKH
jgi:hypothetical protein